MKSQYFVDTHSHLNHDSFDNPADTVARALDEGIRFVLVPGWDLESSEKAISLAEKFEGVYAAVGFHPHDSSKADRSALKRISELSSHNKVVAIGEIGLDYHYNYSPPDTQRSVFEEQIDIAKSAGLPVSVHSRESDPDLMEIILRAVSKGWKLPKRFEYQINDQPRGVLHSFNSTSQIARQAISLGFYLGISGMITFGKLKSESPLQQTVRNIQPEHFLLETDAPYLAPVPHRGKHNEPAFIPLIASRVAELQNLTTEDIMRCTSYNAYKLFGIGEVPEPEIAYRIKDSLYLNLTLRCDSDCIFCDRKGEAMVKGHNLHIAEEPSSDQLKSAIEDPRKYHEIVFCGYGEPTIKLEVIKEVGAWVKKNGGRTRLDTDGHGNVINHRDIIPELRGILDSVSISLNSVDPKEYGRLMGTSNGKQWQTMVEFAREAKSAFDDVYMTVVGLEGEELETARYFVEQTVGVKFRHRPLF